MIGVSQVSRKMRQPPSSLLLAWLCSLSSWTVLSDVLTIHTRHAVVQEGDQILITCCLNSTSESGHMECLRNHTMIESKHVNLMRQSCVRFTFENTTMADSGTYFCRITIDIPKYKKLTGNSTVITVRPRVGPTDQTDDGNGSCFENGPLPIVSAALVLVFLLAVLSMCIWRWRKERVAMVIYEVPGSEGPEMDKHGTTGSAGSTQWCQVALYESIDYFVHVDMKGSD